MDAHGALSGPIRVRAAEPHDAEAIEWIRVRGWQAAYRHIYPAEFLDALVVDGSRWEERISNPPEGWRSFVAELNGAVGGFAVCGPNRDAPGPGELYALYVDPDSWSSGIGQALLQRVEQCLAGDYPAATLWVLEANSRARRFYERSGWILEKGTRPFDYGGVAAQAVRYRKVCTSSTSRS